jgi:hypothetical protein
MLPIYLYKKMMLEKKANISRTLKILGGIGGLGGLVGGYTALNMAEPYFVRKLRESAYGGPNIQNRYTTPTSNFFDAAMGLNSKEEVQKIFNAMDQRFNQLRKGNYAPLVFDPVTGSYDDYRDKSTFFSPIWNALRYINIFNSRSTPVYEDHYKTPREFLKRLEQYANKIEDNLMRHSGAMTQEQYEDVQKYLNQLRHRIRKYHFELDTKGERQGKGVSSEGI